MNSVSLLADSPFDKLVAALNGHAHQQVLFDRDESDSFRIRLLPTDPTQPQLDRAQLMRALPVGSRWHDSVGWESYVVFPGHLLGASHDVTLIALEYVVPHSARGAFPIFGGGIVPTSAVPGILTRIADRLDPETVRPVAATYGVLRSKSDTPAAHAKAASWLLRAAASCFRDAHGLLVRTALLTEDQVPTLRAVVPLQAWLLGSVQPLNKHFSYSARAILFGLRRVGRRSPENYREGWNVK